MNTYEQVNNWLQSTGKALRLDLQLNENGLCYFQHHNGLIAVLEVPSNTDTYCLYAPITDAPEDLGELVALMRWCLQLNMYQSKIREGCLGYSEAHNSFVITYSHTADHNSLSTFQDHLALFFQTAERIRSAIHEVSIKYRSTTPPIANHE